MTMNEIGYAAPSAKVELSPYDIVHLDTRTDDLVIEILYCGTCNSDLQFARNDWNVSAFPMVPPATR